MAEDTLSQGTILPGVSSTSEPFEERFTNLWTWELISRSLHVL